MLMIMPLSAFSQKNTVTKFPSLIEYNGYKLVAFTMDQAKQIAADDIACAYNDSILVVTQENNVNLQNIIIGKDDIISFKDSQISLYQAQITSMRTLSDNKDKMITNKDITIKQQKRQIMWLKAAAITGFVAAVVVPTIILTR